MTDSNLNAINTVAKTRWALIGGIRAFLSNTNQAAA